MECGYPISLHYINYLYYYIYIYIYLLYSIDGLNLRVTLMRATVGESWILVIQFSTVGEMEPSTSLSSRTVRMYILRQIKKQRDLEG